MPTAPGNETGRVGGGRRAVGCRGAGRRAQIQAAPEARMQCTVFPQTAWCLVCKNTKTKGSENLTRHPKTQACNRAARVLQTLRASRMDCGKLRMDAT